VRCRGGEERWSGSGVRRKGRKERKIRAKATQVSNPSNANERFVLLRKHDSLVPTLEMIVTLDDPLVIQPSQHLNLVENALLFPPDEFLGDDLESDGPGGVARRRSLVPGRPDYFSERACS
jgi:hypothetical protein